MSIAQPCIFLSVSPSPGTPQSLLWPRMGNGQQPQAQHPFLKWTEEVAVLWVGKDSEWGLGEESPGMGWNRATE